MVKSKWFKIPYYLFLYVFALIGFGLTGAYFAIYYKWTNESGSVDRSSRQLTVIHDKYSNVSAEDSLQVEQFKMEALNRILLLREFYPVNAGQMLDVYESGSDITEVLRMLDAADLKLRNDRKYIAALKNLKKEIKYNKTGKKQSIYEWMNMREWETFKIAVEKDKKVIDSVSRLTGVESRLIVSCLVGEQIRLFTSDREGYKKWIGPLKVLSVESQFSLGVTGIKDFTAAKIESGIKDSTSIYYLGKNYEHLLDFKSADIESERYNRLTNFRNHFYSYMYAALFLKQMKVQWEKAGYPIDKRPEILATLFNVGYPQSVPKKNPKVGGSRIKINDKTYTFGLIAYQFYYSGELHHLFPIQGTKFDWDTQNDKNEA